MKHTVKGFITYEQGRYHTKPQISFYNFRPSSEHFPDIVVVAEHSIEVEVPDDFDPRVPMVERLRQQKQKVQADFAAKVVEIDRRINELLAIENTMDAALTDAYAEGRKDEREIAEGYEAGREAARIAFGSGVAA